MILYIIDLEEKTAVVEHYQKLFKEQNKYQNYIEAKIIKSA